MTFNNSTSFEFEIGGADRESRDIAAGSRHASGKAVADRIVNHGGHDRNAGGGVLEHARDSRPRGHDDRDVRARQLGGEGGNPLPVSVSETCFDDEIRPLDIAQLAHPLHERLVASGLQRGLAGGEIEEPDPRDL